MIKLPASNKQLALIIGGLLLVNAPLALLLLPSPKASDTAQQGDDPIWQMPTLPEDKDAAALGAKLARSTPWYGSMQQSILSPDGKKRAGVGKIVPDKWEFSGVVVQGDDRYMLLLDAQKKAKRYRVGDTLPDDSELLAIYDDAIEIKKVVEDEPQTERLALYR